MIDPVIDSALAYNDALALEQLQEEDWEDLVEEMGSEEAARKFVEELREMEQG